MDEITFDNLPKAVAAIDKKVSSLIERIDSLLGKDNDANDSKHELLDLKAAAKMVGKATSTLYTMTSMRQIPFHKRGNKLYFFKDELIAWIEAAGESGVESSTEDFADHLAVLKSKQETKAKVRFSINNFLFLPEQKPYYQS